MKQHTKCQRHFRKIRSIGSLDYAVAILFYKIVKNLKKGKALNKQLDKGANSGFIEEFSMYDGFNYKCLHLDSDSATVSIKPIGSLKKKFTIFLRLENEGCWVPESGIFLLGDAALPDILDIREKWAQLCFRCRMNAYEELELIDEARKDALSLVRFINSMRSARV